MEYLSKKPGNSFSLTLKRKLGLKFRTKVCPCRPEDTVKVGRNFSCLQSQSRFEQGTSRPLSPCTDINYTYLLQSVNSYIHYCQCRTPNSGQFQMFKEIVSCYFSGSSSSPYQIAIPSEIQQTLLQYAKNVETFSELLPNKLDRLHVFDESLEFITFCRREAVPLS